MESTNTLLALTRTNRFDLVKGETFTEDFYDLHINNVDIKDCIFESSSFDYGFITNIDFQRCKFKGVRFYALEGWNIAFHDCEFENCSFEGGSYRKLTFLKCAFIKVAFRDIVHTELSIEDCSFLESEVINIEVSPFDIVSCRFVKSIIKGGWHHGSSISNCTFDDAESALKDVDWTVVCDDIWSVLCYSPNEVPFLREALVEGRVNGATYTGECCCLVGTLARGSGHLYDDIADLSPDPSRPAERWFMNIDIGDTPESNYFSRKALGWVDAWSSRVQGVKHGLS